MKKLFLTLILAITICGSSFAQYESNWPDFNGNNYPFQSGIVAAIKIDGQLITAEYEGWDALEVAFFVNGVCRGSGADFPDAVPETYYLYNGYVEEYGDPFPVLDGTAIYYANTNEPVSIQMYDHLNGILYENCEIIYDGEPIEILTGTNYFEGWDDPYNPIFLCFTTPTPGEPSVLEGGPWNEEDTWQDGIIPENINVIINGDVTIPAGYTAVANNITINEGGSLTIEDGGYLIHDGEVEVTMNFSVNGYQNRDNSGYQLFSTPVYNDPINYCLTLNSDQPMVNGDFDLYAFNQHPGDSLEWRNWKVGDHFNLNLKEGYLYARPGESQVMFLAGMAIPTEKISKDLVYDLGAGNWAGWNLLGNPFTCKASITSDADNSNPLYFYELNETGSGVEAEVSESTVIDPTKGFFVKATEDGQQCWFHPYTAHDQVIGGGDAPEEEKCVINVTGSRRAVIDRAIIRFGQGNNLEKLQLNPNHTKVYMPQDGKDYAVLHTENQGEMPVNFKAETNGTYSMNFNTNVKFGYLHLIDNLTGIDTDLLANPSYSFEAKTTDYASRFKLVFAMGNNDDTFAFFSNGSFVINNEGNATLQVIDVNGRILNSESINGCANVNANAAPGVYMIRLINGDNVKVQKVVVR